MHQTGPTQGELSFDLLAEIAVGATARVELCQVADGPLSDELVAVKRLHPHIADDPRFLDMFRDEVWMTAALKHENVVEVKGWGHDGHGPWLAVEFVRGVSLQRLMKTVFETGEMFTERMVVYLARCVCDGLANAHDLRGSSGEALHLVHRDMTPGNILLGFEGQVKITDFGLAKAKQRLTKTLTGLLKGQPQYMSPEQVNGRPLDGRSDIFAFGVVLFELFSGRRPWNANTDLDVMRAITDEPPGDLLSFRPRIDRALGDVVAKCLEKDPANRWQSAASLRDRFDEWLDVHGYRSDNDVSLARFVRRNAMRQMRWFERAVAGEFAEEAKANQPPPPPGAPQADEVSHSDAIDPPEPVDWGEDGPTLVQPSEPVHREAAAKLEAKKASKEQDTDEARSSPGEPGPASLGGPRPKAARIGKAPRREEERPEDSSPSKSTPRAKSPPRIPGAVDPAEAETPRATPPKRPSKAKPPPRKAKPEPRTIKAKVPARTASMRGNKGPHRPRAETITEAHADSLPRIGAGDEDDLQTERRNPWSHIGRARAKDNSGFDLGEVGMRMRDLFKEERQTDDTLGVVAPPDPDVPPIPGARLPTRPGPPPTPPPGAPASGQRPVPQVGEDLDDEPVTRPDAPRGAPRPGVLEPVEVGDTAATRPINIAEAEQQLAIADPPSETAQLPVGGAGALAADAPAAVDVAREAERLGEAAQAAAKAATHAAELADARARAARLAAEAALLSATGHRHAAMQKLRQAMRVDEAIERGQPPPRERPYALDAVLASELDPGLDLALDPLQARRPPAPTDIMDRNTLFLIGVVVVIFGLLMAIFLLT